MIDQGETREEDVKAKVFANEYTGQDVVLYGSERLTVYRTYGPKTNDKIEVYAGQRVGNR